MQLSLNLEVATGRVVIGLGQSVVGFERSYIYCSRYCGTNSGLPGARTRPSKLTAKAVKRIVGLFFSCMQHEMPHAHGFSFSSITVAVETSYFPAPYQKVTSYTVRYLKVILPFSDWGI